MRRKGKEDFPPGFLPGFFFGCLMTFLFLILFHLIITMPYFTYNNGYVISGQVGRDSAVLVRWRECLKGALDEEAKIK